MTERKACGAGAKYFPGAASIGSWSWSRNNVLDRRSALEMNKTLCGMGLAQEMELEPPKPDYFLQNRSWSRWGTKLRTGSEVCLPP